MPNINISEILINIRNNFPIFYTTCIHFFNSAFFGAVFSVFGAFSLNKLIESHKKKQEKLDYLKYTIVSSLDLLGILYGLKKGLIDHKFPKYEQESIDKIKEPPIINIDTYKEHSYSLPIELEKLIFTAKINPSITTLLLSIIRDGIDINKTIPDFNSHLKFTNTANYYPQIQNYRNSLISISDGLIFNIELLIKCLTKTGKIIDNKFPKYEIDGKTYSSLRPNPKNYPEYENLEKWAEEE